MDKRIIEIAKRSKSPYLRVAAYCRVSTMYEEQDLSLESQIERYTKLIQSCPTWTLVDIYADRHTGTEFKGRKGFEQMMKAVNAGKVDLILTKSISRLGRNIVPFMKSLRKMKKENVVMNFEQEGIYTDEEDTECMIGILASLAQGESQSKSEDIKWGLRCNFRNGKGSLNHTQFLGYTKDASGRLVIVEEEATIVRLIFRLSLQGYGTRKIKRYLEEHGIKTVTGKSTWSTATLDRMLSNEKYAGHMLLQKTFVEDPLTHRKVKNEGQLPKYWVENSHEAIIKQEDFDAVQQKKSKKR